MKMMKEVDEEIQVSILLKALMFYHLQYDSRCHNSTLCESTLWYDEVHALTAAQTSRIHDNSQSNAIHVYQLRSYIHTNKGMRESSQNMT